MLSPNSCIPSTRRTCGYDGRGLHLRLCESARHPQDRRGRRCAPPRAQASSSAAQSGTRASDPEALALAKLRD